MRRMWKARRRPSSLIRQQGRAWRVEMARERPNGRESFALVPGASPVCTSRRSGVFGTVSFTRYRDGRGDQKGLQGENEGGLKMLWLYQHTNYSAWELAFAVELDR